MNKTDEELNQAEKMAKRHGVRMCDENGDTHGEELYCVGIDNIADIIREARAEQDHIADTGKMVGCAYCDTNLLAGSECGNCGMVTLAEPANTRSTSEYSEPVKQEPVARPFECWSTNDGDSWFEHPADAQLIYDVLGDDPKVGDEFEVSAGWNCVTATYQIASKDGDDFEVKCVSHPNNDTAPASAEAIRAEALEEAAKVCEKAMIQMNYSEAPYKQCAAAIRGLK